MSNLTVTVTDQGKGDFSSHWAEVTFHFEGVDGKDSQTIYLPAGDARELESALKQAQVREETQPNREADQLCHRSVLQDSWCARPINHTGNHRDREGWEKCIHGIEVTIFPCEKCNPHFYSLQFQH